MEYIDTNKSFFYFFANQIFIVTDEERGRSSKKKKYNIQTYWTTPTTGNTQNKKVKRKYLANCKLQHSSKSLLNSNDAFEDLM